MTFTPDKKPLTVEEIESAIDRIVTVPHDWELRSLRVNPFEGDQVTARCFKDKIVTAKNEYDCDGCGGTIAEKTRHRVVVERFDGAMHTARFCTRCAQSQAWSDQFGDCHVGCLREMIRRIRGGHAQDRSLFKEYLVGIREQQEPRP